MSRAVADVAPACICEIHAEAAFRVDGMCCHEEATVLERRLKQLGGLEAIAADVLKQRLHVKYDAARLTTSAICETVAQTGMRAWLEHEDARLAPPPGVKVRQLLIAASGAALAAGLVMQLVDAPAAVARACFAAAIVCGGVHVARRALAALGSKALDMNVLMLIAVLGAAAIDQWSEGATVVFLFGLAQLLEARTMERARHAISALMELTPTEAVVKRGVHFDRTPVDQVRIGDVIVVKPGEKFPLDGLVAAGVSDVNQAPVTGESIPVEKQPGDDVFAGSINGHGALDVEVTRLRRDSTLARIVHLVETAQAQRAPTQAFIDRFARIYTPVVIALAVAVAAIPIAWGQPPGPWIYRALVLLVIACPCALVISTPVAIVSALAGAARKGVLFKGGLHLERAGAIRCLAFDKTGTLTTGDVEVTDVFPLDGATADDVLRHAAALDARAEHPVARAIVAYARGRGVHTLHAEDYRALPGLGAEARLNGVGGLIGAPRLFEARGLLSADARALADAATATGRTPVIVAINSRILGVIGVADRARDASREAVDLLRRHGVSPIVMLTGDHEAVARQIGAAAGVDEVRAGLLPEDKVRAIEELRRMHGPIAMVGDGVNDAPALAAADIGVAMGAVGTDAALETADVALMNDELLKIPYAIRISRAAMRTVRVNVAFSLGLKAVFLGLAVFGAASLWMAVIADTGATIIVVANGLRLLRAD